MPISHYQLIISSPNHFIIERNASRATSSPSPRAPACFVDPHFHRRLPLDPLRALLTQVWPTTPFYEVVEALADSFSAFSRLHSFLWPPSIFQCSSWCSCAGGMQGD